MAMSLNEIAEKSAQWADQTATAIGNYPINWVAVAMWGIVIIVGFWLLGRILAFLEYLQRKLANKWTPRGPNG
jgi:hypothetical protein